VHRVGGDTVAHDVTFPYRVTDADDHLAIADPVADPEPDGWAARCRRASGGVPAAYR